MRSRVFFIVLISLLTITRLTSQEESVNFEALVSKKSLGLNENLRVDFKLNKDGDNFNPPSL